MSHAATITSPKPMSAGASNTAARGLSAKKSLADSRVTTGKQLWQPSVNTIKYVRSARQGEKLLNTFM